MFTYSQAITVIGKKRWVPFWGENWDNTNACIDFIGITDYITSVLDEIKKVGIDAKHEETIDALEMIEDYMLEKLGKGISTDRRLLFSIRYKEEKHQEEIDKRSGLV